jgi:hypothetical protein
MVKTLRVFNTLRVWEKHTTNPPYPPFQGGQRKKGKHMKKLIELLASRKFWAALVGLGIIILKAYRPDFPVSEEEITNLVAVLAAYILGTAISNAADSLKTASR